MKKFKTLDEQVATLMKRDLNIADRDRAKQYLFSNNYYLLINGYSVYFRESKDQDGYITGSTFEEISQLYFYDKELKNTFLKNIVIAEKHFKSILAYQFAKYYQDDEEAYLKADSYNPKKKYIYNETIRKIKSTIRYHQERNFGNPIRHYKNTYNVVPMWVLINYLTFGQAVYMFDALPGELKVKIANSFGTFFADHGYFSSPLSPSLVLTSLKNLVELRNVCAHDNRLLDFKAKGDIAYSVLLHPRYEIDKRARRRDVFNSYISLRLFLTKTQFAQLHNTIIKRTKYLDNNLNAIKIDDILATLGFPKNWHNYTDTIKH